MAETAIVLVVKQTGNVLATVTRTGDPAAAPPAAELAGERFPVRDASGELVVEVANAALESKAIPSADDLLLNPQSCAVEDDAPALLSKTVTPAIAATGVTLTVAPNPTEAVPVWVQVDHGAGQARRHVVLTGELPTTGSVVLPKTFAPGDYDVLALVRGYLPGVLTGQTV